MSLTDKQKQAVRIFKQLESPTLAEWAEAMGVSYPIAVWYRDQLVKRGYMTFVAKKSRSLKLTEKGRRTR